MKKFYFLFLFALIASISNLYAAEKTVTWNFQQSERLANGEICKDKVATTTGAVGAWTVNSTNKTYVAGCGNQSLGSGIQLGSGTYSFNGSLALSGAEIPEGATVKKVSFFVASNGSNYSCSMSINGSTVGNTLKIGKKPAWKEYDFGTISAGAKGIVFNISGTSKNYLAIKSISITYEEVAETKCATPTFNLTADATYTDAQTLEITSTTADATIHYTINGGAENTGQPAEFTENGVYTVDAWATKDGLTDSEHASITFTIDKKCAAPTFSLASGSYTTAQTVTITGPEGSTITYTLNDDIFDAPSPVNVELPLVEGVSTTYNLSALASMKDFKDSEETKAVYVINESYADKTATLNIANYASANKWVDGTQYPDVEIDDVKFAINGGGIDGKYYESNKTWRVYASNSGTLTISVPAMHIISSVVYKAANAFAKADSGTLSKVTTGEWKWDAAATNTTEGDPVNSVIFTAGNKKNVELKEIKVYYAYDPVSSVSSMSSEGVKVVAAEGGVEVVAEEAAEVAVYTAAGQLVRQARVAEGSTLVNVAPGFYVVRANGTATKVIVR